MAKRNKKVIFPNVFTALNIFCGFLAIIYVARENPDFAKASWLIVFAAVFDSLDGKIARMTKSFSEFGIEFDSLADIVSFGVAPAILIYQVYFYELGDLGKLLSFLPLLLGGIRLARFNINVSGFEKGDFTGMPIPASAICLASFVIFSREFANPMAIYSKAFIPLVILMSFLMISNIGYETMPRFSLKRGKANVVKLVIVLTSLTSIAVFREVVLFPLVLGYIFYGIVRRIVQLFKNNTNGIEPADPTTSN